MNKQTAIFINTRPVRSDVEVEINFADEMLSVLHLPLIELCPIVPNDEDKCAMADFINGHYQVVVAVSVTAAKLAINHLMEQGVHHANDLVAAQSCRFVAVGEATKKELVAFGFKSCVPDEMSNESMLQMPIIKALGRGDKVLIWRGVGGRRLLHDTLVNKGVSVQAIAWYERMMCQIKNVDEETQSTLRQLHRYDEVFVLISSQLSWQAWQNLNPFKACNGTDNNANAHQKITYLALGKRLTNLVKIDIANKPTDIQMGVQMIDDLNTQTLHTAMRVAIVKNVLQ